MVERNGISKITQAAGIVALIGSIALGVFTLDARYAKSADLEKVVVSMENSLKKIYVQQLKQEEREIKRMPDAKLTDSEKRRIENIKEEIKILQTQR